jgi:hypothetical protein
VGLFVPGLLPDGAGGNAELMRSSGGVPDMRVWVTVEMPYSVSLLECGPGVWHRRGRTTAAR